MGKIWLYLKRKKAIHILPWIALLVAGVLAAANGQVVSGGAQAVATQPSPQNADLVMAQAIREALQSDQLSAGDKAALGTKLALAERAAIRPTPEVVDNLPRVVLPTVAMPTFPAEARGILPEANQETIINGSEGLVHGWEAAVQNLWMGERNGVDYEVFAGAAADDPSQGWLRVAETNQGQASQSTYLSPAKDGALRILQVDGTRVKLSTGSGGTLYFNLATRAFEP